ncbi:MAG: DUF4468 domain-containing protein [Prevotella sp.]|nr:DUF4468 domain-containing protein [Prevotella sp.]
MEILRKAMLAMLLLLPLSVLAQNTWEKPEEQKKSQSKSSRNTNKQASEKEYQYAYYCGDVVPVVNGEVVWEKTYTNTKTVEENYAAMLNYLTAMTKEEGQLENSNVSLINKTEHKIVCHFEEWMVFTNALLSLDRTRFIYTLIAECRDHQVYIKIFRLNYWYEELRDGGFRYKAEEWITDEFALNKKHTRLAKISGKFRRKTVDRVKEILDNIAVVIDAKQN